MFNRGRISIEDAPREGMPLTNLSDQSVNQIKEPLDEFRGYYQRLISARRNIPKTTVHEILHNKLGMRKT